MAMITQLSANGPANVLGHDLKNGFHDKSSFKEPCFDTMKREKSEYKKLLKTWCWSYNDI